MTDKKINEYRIKQIKKQLKELSYKEDITVDKYKHGEVRYCDCMNPKYGLPSLKDNCFELCLTDPPYNVNHKSGIQTYNEKYTKDKVEYKDNLPKTIYHMWCKEWYKQLERITNYRIFTCGYSNINFWFNYKHFEMLIWYNNYRQGGSKVAKLNKFEPILCDGNFKQRKIISSVLHYNHGFNMKFDLLGCVHPCPNPKKVYKWVIKGFNFNDTVIDPFLGSGTTAEVCEDLGIKWLGFEIKEEYKQDINRRIDRVKRKNKNKFY